MIRRQPPQLQLRVDPVACDGFGYCAELLREVVTIDEWGFPVIDPGPLPPGLIDDALWALRQCPRRALFIEEIRQQPN